MLDSPVQAENAVPVEAEEAAVRLSGVDVGVVFEVHMRRRRKAALLQHRNDEQVVVHAAEEHAPQAVEEALAVHVFAEVVTELYGLMGGLVPDHGVGAPAVEAVGLQRGIDAVAAFEVVEENEIGADAESFVEASGIEHGSAVEGGAHAGNVAAGVPGEEHVGVGEPEEAVRHGTVQVVFGHLFEFGVLFAGARGVVGKAVILRCHRAEGPPLSAFEKAYGLAHFFERVGQEHVVVVEHHDPFAAREQNAAVEVVSRAQVFAVAEVADSAVGEGGYVVFCFVGRAVPGIVVHHHDFPGEGHGLLFEHAFYGFPEQIRAAAGGNEHAHPRRGFVPEVRDHVRGGGQTVHVRFVVDARRAGHRPSPS